LHGMMHSEVIVELSCWASGGDGGGVVEEDWVGT
jgi:hypothetical protein